MGLHRMRRVRGFQHKADELHLIWVLSGMRKDEGCGF